MTHPYAREAYVRSLPHVGRPVAVPEWRGWVLARPIAGSRREDITGPYPLCILPPDADLAGGLQRLREAGFVSVVLVTGERPGLADAFDAVRPFKTHQVYDPTLGPPAYAKHHRYEVRRALSRVRVEEITLAEHLAAWTALYGALVRRHGLSDLHAFPPDHHAALAQLNGVRTFGAFVEDRLVAAHLFVQHAGQAISHLAASSEEGYGHGAAYAVNDAALKALGRDHVVNLGGGAGGGDDPADGLVRFKRGFANTTATATLCSAVLDPDAYAELSRGADAAFFPAYRSPVQERTHVLQG